VKPRDEGRVVPCIGPVFSCVTAVPVSAMYLFIVNFDILMGKTERCGSCMFSINGVIYFPYKS
jgi:hypothetical protein